MYNSHALVELTHSTQSSLIGPSVARTVATRESNGGDICH